MSRFVRILAALGVVTALSASVGGASPSPDLARGDEIVFASDFSPGARLLDGHVGSVRLHAFALDGRPRVDFSAGAGTDSDSLASLAPDGRTVAFVRTSPDRGSQLWVANEDGSGARVLATPEPGESFSFEGFDGLSFQRPEWSPDGTKLAVDASSVASCSPNVTKCASWYTVILDLQGRRLRVTGGLNATWSPDGRYVALLTGLFSLEDPEAWELLVERADGTVVARWGVEHKRRGACWNDALWSPDSARLVLVEGACGHGADRRLHLIRAGDWQRAALLDGCCATWIPGSRRLAYLPPRSAAAVTTVSHDGTDRGTIPGTRFPTWSPTGTRMAYVRPGRERLEVVVARGDGARPRMIAAGRWRAAWVTRWSPDGRQLLLTTLSGTVATTAVVRASGGPVRPVHRDVEGAWHYARGWTAGDRVLVSRGVSALYPHDLWTMRPDGSGLRRLTKDRSGGLDPVWSPDRSQVAFWRDIPRKGSRPERLAVFVVAARGGAARFVVGGRSGAFARDPDWSPNGKRLVFLRSSGRQGYDLFTVSIAGTGLRRVTSTGAAYAPAWSPDGHTIAFSNDGRLSLVAASGGVPRPLGDEELLRYCSGVDWAPDGRRLAADCNGRLIVVDRDGTLARVLAAATSSSGPPAWSPDGSRIVFESADRLEIVAAGGGPATAIDLRGAKGSDPDW